VNVEIMMKMIQYLIIKVIEYKQKDEDYTNQKALEINNSNYVEVVEHMLNQINTHIENLTSGAYSYRVKRFNSIIINYLQTKVARGSSYIKTPEKFANSRCGLINIQNDDQECFRWCLRYHQTKKSKNDDRISVLSKVEDKYNYDGIEFPVSFNDITKFENNNQVCIFVYYIDDKNKIVKERNGNTNYFNKDVVYLLRIEDDSSKSHYIYIKHISRLLNLSTHVGDDGKRFCPYC
jgi:hypothetical protein